MDLYLDSNAHVPMSAHTIKTLEDFNSSAAGHGHPSSLSLPGRAAASALELARTSIAAAIGANSSQIVFTHSCSQAANWGLKIFAAKAKSLAVSPLEHPAVTDALDEMGLEIEMLTANQDGVCQRTSKDLICTHVQNEIGTIQDLKSLGSSRIFSDMSQSLGKIPVDVKDVDVAIFGAHKFGGPSIGWMYLKETSDWLPHETGSRYFMDIAGSPNVGGIVAAAAALTEAIETRPLRTEKMAEFQLTLENGLEAAGFEIVGKTNKRVVNTSFIGGFKGRAAQMVLELGELGIHVGLGSACGSMHSGPSPLMKRLGRVGGIHDYMRISQWGGYGKKEAEVVVAAIKKLI